VLDKRTGRNHPTVFPFRVFKGFDDDFPGIGFAAVFRRNKDVGEIEDIAVSPIGEKGLLVIELDKKPAALEVVFDSHGGEDVSASGILPMENGENGIRF
jgi:hypothetical protein